MRTAADENLCVVVVDDDAVFAEWLSATVKTKSTFNLIHASSARDFFDLISKKIIDCIVLDYDLGDLSGFEIKRCLDDQWPEHPPVVMLTGDGRERTAIRAFHMGVDDYLPKLNLKPEFFVATVSKVVDKRRRNTAAMAGPLQLCAS